MNALISVTETEEGGQPVTAVAAARLIEGDAKSLVAHPDLRGAVQTAVTSPPYWGVRDYDFPEQLGSEATVEEYVAALAEALGAVWDTLSPSGTLWLNLGDVYTSGGRTWRAPDPRNGARAMGYRPQTPAGLKPKELVGVPWRVAFELQRRGWYLRAEQIWNKPNAQPESVRDRPTRSHEHLFLLAKGERYYYNVDGARGPNNRRMRSVWDIHTRAYPAARGHFATFPPALVEACVRLTSRPGDLVLDPFVGSGTTALVAMSLGRRALGVDHKRAYLRMAAERLAAAGFPSAISPEEECPL